jgi:hypothetical protein
VSIAALLMRNSMSESETTRMENEVTIHVRFSPDGTVAEIGLRPAAATPQGWFDTLSAKFGGSFRAMSGDRGIFKVAAEKLSELQTTWPQREVGNA